MSTFPPAGDPTCTLLWAPDGDAFVLNAMLIDSPEPLWRRRPLLVEESIDSENGPMTHWVLRPGLYLEVGESADTAAVQQITRTESGARALIYLKGADRTPRIKLELCRRNFAVSPTAFAAPENLEKFTLLDFELPVRAPWVEE